MVPPQVGSTSTAYESADSPLNENDPPAPVVAVSFAYPLALVPLIVRQTPARGAFVVPSITVPEMVPAAGPLATGAVADAWADAADATPSADAGADSTLRLAARPTQRLAPKRRRVRLVRLVINFMVHLPPSTTAPAVACVDQDVDQRSQSSKYSSQNARVSCYPSQSDRPHLGRYIWPRAVTC